MNRILNIKYGAVHGIYWMHYGVIGSFASAFFLGRGYTNGEIGLILAITSIVSVLLQPILADISDRLVKNGSMTVGTISVAVMGILTFPLFYITSKSIYLSIIYILLYGILMALQPLFNAMVFKLEETGYSINFGVCRSVGSFAYASLCAVLGILVGKHGIEILPKVGFVICLFLLFILVSISGTFRKAKAEKGENKHFDVEKVEAGDKIGLADFVKRNPVFVVMNLGIILLFFQNNITNNFMLQIVENVGGDAEDMGKIFSVMAFLEVPGLFFFSKIRRRFTCQSLLKFSAVCFIGKLLTMYLAKSVMLIYVAHIFHIFSFPIFLSAIVMFTGEIMERGEAVKGQALYTTCITISSVLASVFGGLVLDAFGAKSMLLAAVILTVIGAGFVIFLVDKIRKN